MTLRSPYRYVAEAMARDGRHLADLALDPDFEPAAECSHLHGMRTGLLRALAHHGPGVIEPVYDEERGRPYVQGVRVRFDAAGTAHALPVIPWSYFQGAVEQAATRLIEACKLAAGETFIYRICAFPQSTPLSAANPDPDVEDVAPVVLVLVRGDVKAALSGAVKLGEDVWDERDLPVFIHRAVLDEATQLARTADDRETGGILVGHLHRDDDSHEIHVEITAQVTAEKARSGRAHLGFTPESWSAMRDALALRRRNEMMLGWWHFHPHWCKRCDPEQRQRCALSQPFFSRDDRELHRTVFDAAFNVALLLSDTGAEQLHYDFFGWRHGSVTARGAHVVTNPGAAVVGTYPDGTCRRAAQILTVKENGYEH